MNTSQSEVERGLLGRCVLCVEQSGCRRFVTSLQRFLTPGLDLLCVENPTVTAVEAVKIFHGLVFEK